MPRPSAEELGRAIRSAYEAANVKQEEIAVACDVDQTTVSKWAKGQRWPPVYATESPTCVRGVRPPPDAGHTPTGGRIQ